MSDLEDALDTIEHDRLEGMPRDPDSERQVLDAARKVANPDLEIEVSDPGVLSIQVFSPPDGLDQSWSLPPGRYLIIDAAALGIGDTQ